MKNTTWLCGKCEQMKIPNFKGEVIPKHSPRCALSWEERLKIEWSEPFCNLHEVKPCLKCGSLADFVRLELGRERKEGQEEMLILAQAYIQHEYDEDKTDPNNFNDEFYPYHKGMEDLLKYLKTLLK